MEKGLCRDVSVTTFVRESVYVTVRCPDPDQDSIVVTSLQP